MKNLRKLDFKMNNLIIEYLLSDVERVGCEFKLEKDVSERLKALEKRYGNILSFALISHVLNNTLDQIEVEYELDLKEGLK